jgi:hypothetical protein
MAHEVSIPIVEVYRGVGVHDEQSPERIENVVKPAIDYVHSVDDLALLADYATDPANPPEARILALAKVEAGWQLAAEERRIRPGLDLDVIRARCVGLDSSNWRHRRRYCSMFDRMREDRAVLREQPIPKSAADLAADERLRIFREVGTMGAER